MILVIAVAAALLVGFLAGVVSFKKTNEYCDRHGVTRLCPLCADAQEPSTWELAPTVKA
ncbi:hypothetical protein ACFY36_37895 [Actinoplanes sp. NPDC000266]